MDSGTRIIESTDHNLHIMDHADGKLILFITCIEEGIADGFTVGLAPPSLAALRAASTEPAFDWTINDGSLRVVGLDGAWALTFTMNAPPFLSTTLALSAAETNATRNALLHGPIGRPGADIPEV